MANHKATKKDVRQAEKRRDRNRYYGKTTRNAIRDLKAIKEKKEAGEKMPEVASMIDKMAKKGIIHKNKAANLKRKLARRLNTLDIVKDAGKEAVKVATKGAGKAAAGKTAGAKAAAAKK